MTNVSTINPTIPVAASPLDSAPVRSNFLAAYNDINNIYTLIASGGGGGSGSVTSVNASGGTTGLTFTGGPVTSTGTLTLGGTLALANGGTGATTQLGAATNILPAQAGQGGKVLITDGSVTSWQSPSGTGSVTSVNVSGGTTGLTSSGGPVTVSGTITLAGTLAIANGGTGGTTASAAINALVPTQTSNSGKYLTTNGTSVSWATVAGSGTVTSVAVSGGTTGLTTSGGPVTSTGTITIAGTLALANGGTGATTASAARTNLGVPSIAQAAGNQVWAPIGFRGRGVFGTGGNNTITVTGTGGTNTQTIYWTPSAIPITATKLIFANFDLSSSGEADKGAGEIWNSFACSLNFQMVNAVPPSYTFYGARQGALTAPQSPFPHGMLISDSLNYPMPANNSFGVRVCGSLAATTTYAGCDYQNPGGGSVSDTRMNPGPATPGGSGISNYTEFDHRDGVTWTDLTQTSATETPSGASYSLCPTIILGLMPAPAASVVFFGDSIDQGQNFYTADQFYNYGYIQQGLTNTIPYVNLSRGTMQAANFNTFSLKAGVLTLVTGGQMYVTDFVMGLGRNDIAAGHSATSAQADVALASLEFQQAGIPVHVQTVPPNTASQDVWTTLANQFYIVKSPTTTGTINIGDTTFTVSSATGITNGMLVGSQYGIGIFPGTTITISGTTVTLSHAVTATIASGRSMYFGNATPSTYTSTALTYNAALLAGYNNPSYNSNGYVYKSVIDIASVLGNVSGSDFKWAVGAGSTNFTNDGIHPNQAGGTALNVAGIPGTSRFG